MKPSELLRSIQKQRKGGEPFHYVTNAIEPIDFIVSNGLDFCEGNVVKYVSRYKAKDGLKDLYKARDYLEVLIQREEEDGAEAKTDEEGRSGNSSDVFTLL